MALMRTVFHFTPEDIDFLITSFKMWFSYLIRLKNLEKLLKLKNSLISYFFMYFFTMLFLKCWPQLRKKVADCINQLNKFFRVCITSEVFTVTLR